MEKDESDRIRAWFEHLQRLVGPTYVARSRLADVLASTVFDGVTEFLRHSAEPHAQPATADFSGIIELLNDLGWSPDERAAADGVFNLWASFGTAIQFKYMTLSIDVTEGEGDGVMADRVFIVCDQADVNVVDVVLRYFALRGRVQGFITEVDLLEWYSLCFGPKYADTLGRRLLAELGRQFEAEFPASRAEVFDGFFAERGYAAGDLAGEWACPS